MAPYLSKGLKVCGVTTSDPSKVRNDEFHKNIMKKELKTWENETLDDDPFAEESTNIAEI